jgi:hypothetical protein
MQFIKHPENENILVGPEHVHVLSVDNSVYKRIGNNWYHKFYTEPLTFDIKDPSKKYFLDTTCTVHNNQYFYTKMIQEKKSWLPELFTACMIPDTEWKRIKVSKEPVVPKETVVPAVPAVPKETVPYKISPSTGVKEYNTSYGLPFNVNNEVTFLEYEKAYKVFQQG